MRKKANAWQLQGCCCTEPFARCAMLQPDGCGLLSIDSVTHQRGWGGSAHRISSVLGSWDSIRAQRAVSGGRLRCRGRIPKRPPKRAAWKRKECEIYGSEQCRLAERCRSFTYPSISLRNCASDEVHNGNRHLYKHQFNLYRAINDRLHR